MRVCLSRLLGLLLLRCSGLNAFSNSPRQFDDFRPHLLRDRDWQDRPEFRQLCDWWQKSLGGVYAWSAVAVPEWRRLSIGSCTSCPGAISPPFTCESGLGVTGHDAAAIFAEPVGCVWLLLEDQAYLPARERYIW